MRTTTTLVSTFICMMMVTSVLAHHGTSLYQMDKQIVLTGTVKEWRWGSPHTWLWITVPASSGASEEWSIESPPPNWMQRQGWSEKTLKAGDRVSIKASPRRGEARAGILVEITRPGGEVLVIRRP